MNQKEQVEPLCSDDLFRYFIRINFSKVLIKNKECDEIHLAFSRYLRVKCTDQQLSNFLPKSEVEVMLGKDHPLNMNGFHPAFMFHFTEFIDEQKKLIEEEK